jgi:hypothetical protein
LSNFQQNRAESKAFEDTFQRETQKIENVDAGSINEYKNLYSQICLPNPPPMMPHLQSSPSAQNTRDYAHNSLIPDYKSLYSINSAENSNPNIQNPLQNSAFNFGKEEAFNSNINSILCPQKPCDFPSDIGFSPIDQNSEETPFVQKKPVHVYEVSPTKLEWGSSSGAKSDDEEEYEPRKLPIHIVSHIPQQNKQQEKER